MNSKTIYTKAPKDIEQALTYGKTIPDFLPPPELLVRRGEKIRITISLNKRVVDFFKHQATRQKVKYQTMINNVLDIYANNYARVSK